MLAELLEEPHARLDRQGDGLGVLEGDPRLPVERVRVLVAGGLGAAAGALGSLARNEGFEVELGCLRHVVYKLRSLSLSTWASIRNSQRAGRLLARALRRLASLVLQAAGDEARLASGAACSAPDAATARRRRRRRRPRREGPRGPRRPGEPGADRVRVAGAVASTARAHGWTSRHTSSGPQRAASHEAMRMRPGRRCPARGGDPSRRTGRCPARERRVARPRGPARAVSAHRARRRRRRVDLEGRAAPAASSIHPAQTGAPVGGHDERVRPRVRRDRAAAAPRRPSSQRLVVAGDARARRRASAGCAAALVSPRPGMRPPSSASARTHSRSAASGSSGRDAAPPRRSGALDLGHQPRGLRAAPGARGAATRPPAWRCRWPRRRAPPWRPARGRAGLRCRRPLRGSRRADVGRSSRGATSVTPCARAQLASARASAASGGRARSRRASPARRPSRAPRLSSRRPGFFAGALLRLRGGPSSGLSFFVASPSPPVLLATAPSSRRAPSAGPPSCRASTTASACPSTFTLLQT